jgi:hypothetical protein
LQPASKHCRTCNTTKTAEHFHLDAARSDGLAYRCKACQTAYCKAHYTANREKRLASVRQWKEANPETRRASQQRHYRNNVGAYQACSSQRRALKRQLVPWADKAQIRAIYAQARALRSWGIDVHVDHVVPLRSPLVCGLHVQTNLVIVLKAENLAKSNLDLA